MGLGVGLTLVKSIVELHGGKVEVHSEGHGRGSEFVVRLPICTRACEAPEVVGVHEDEVTARRRILIVDDNRDGADSLAILLTTHGHTTHVAHDGLEGLGAAERPRPDLVLFDIGLPKLNGYDACRQIREQSWGRDMVLVALTGYGRESDVRDARAAGFNHHLLKPVDYGTLDRVLRALPTVAA